MMRQAQRCSWPALVFISLLLCQGCRTSPREGTHGPVQVSLLPDGGLDVEGVRTDPSQLQRRLKAVGARPQTPIIVSVPDQTPKPQLAAVAREFSRAGFPRVMFTGPRRAAAYVRQP
jgi:hypothetical protein